MADAPYVVKNFIAGESVGAKNGFVYELVDPVTGESYAEAPRSQPEDVERAYLAAQDAFEGWATKTPSHRSLALLKFADALEARSDELVDIECRNTGKPRELTLSEEIPPMIDQIRFFAGACRLLKGRAAGEYMEGFTSFVRREPIGVCGQITPWNYPMMMAVWKFAPAIAAGNTVVIKPAPAIRDGAACILLGSVRIAGAGLITTVFPTAMAGANFHTAIIIG